MATAELNHAQACDEIKKAWRAGKKQVTINGVKLNLRSVKRLVSYVDNKVPMKREEVDIIASPVGKAQIPCFNVVYSKKVLS